MSWTYNSGVTTTNDKVRLLIGDTDSTDPLLTDAELNFLTGQAGSIYGVAALACQAIAAKYARQVDKRVGDLALSSSQKAKHYAAEAQKYAKLGAILVTPIAGGISIDAKDVVDSDSDRVRPSFSRGQFANDDTIDDSRWADYTGEDS